MHHVGQAQSKVLNELIVTEGDLLVLGAKVLHCRLPHSLVADADRLDRHPCCLGRWFGCQGGNQLRQNGTADHLQCGAIIVELDVAVLDNFLEVALLQLQLHEQRQRIIVRHSELQPVAGATAILDDALDDYHPRMSCIPGA